MLFALATVLPAGEQIVHSDDGRKQEHPAKDDEEVDFLVSHR